MTGYGSGGYGATPWGGGAGSDFDLLSASAVDSTTVDLTFSADVLLDSVALNAATYSIDGGLVVYTAVAGSSPNIIRLTTSPQTAAQLYEVTVLTTVQDVDARPLMVNTAFFLGEGEVVAAFVVSEATARTYCEGKSIRLSWTNPVGTLHMKVVRRLRAWPFDLTDAHDVVYDGDPITEFFDTGIATPSSIATAPLVVGAGSVNVVSGAGFVIGQEVKIENLVGERLSDNVILSGVAGATLSFSPPLAHAYATGARVSLVSELQPQTYYYYLILVSTSATPTTYDITEASRALALSIDMYDGKSWFTDNAPSIYLERDRVSAAEGGGGGFLDKWFTVMGCWLNLMRGNANAMKLIADPDKAPFHVLGAANRSLGIEPEGDSYDLDIVRRPLTSLAYVYKRKGTCPGIVEAVRMFTKWEAICTEFGFNRCGQGVGLLQTWDGTSVNDFGQSSSTITITVLNIDGSAKVTDSSKAWDVGLFDDGTVRGWIGDIACVDHSTATELFTKPPPMLTTLSVAASAGGGAVTLASTAGLVPGMDFQITNASLQAEIVTARLINPGTGVVSLSTLLQFSHAVGSRVSIQKSIIRSSYNGPAATQVGAALQDTFALFTTHQWRGYKLRDSAGTVFDVTDSDGQYIFLSGTPASGTYKIAKAFTGATPQYRYRVGNGIHSNTFEPTYDDELRGTIYDPFSPMYVGAGAAVLAGIFGPADIGVYIQTSVTQTKGAATAVTSTTFTLDPTQPAPAVNAFAGMYLNPNQNQTRMFLIVSNTATEITLEEDASSLVVVGQTYYVLKARDKVRFQRLDARLREEFTDTDTTPHVLFS